MRSQMHLRHIMVDLNMHPLNEPELFLGNARDAFDEEMRIRDKRMKFALKKLLENLLSWAEKVNRSD